MQRTGKVQIVAELATRYRVVDEYEHRPASLRTLKSRAKFVPDLRVPWWILLLTVLKSPKI